MRSAQSETGRLAALLALGLPCLALAANGGGPAKMPIPYRPFIDPLELHGAWWLLLIPMSLGVAVVYKAVRLATLERYWQQVLMMTLQIIITMIVLAAASYVLVLVYVRLIAERAG